MGAAKSILAKDIQAYIETHLLHGQTIAPDQNLLLTGILDSLAVMALVTELERRSSAPIPPQDLTVENFQSVAAMEAYLNRRQAA